MREMGANEAACHREVGEAAAASGLDALYLLGRFARDTRQGALAAGMERAAVHVARTHRKLGWELRAELRKGDWVLVKGSRGARHGKGSSGHEGRGGVASCCIFCCFRCIPRSRS